MKPAPSALLLLLLGLQPLQAQDPGALPAPALTGIIELDSLTLLWNDDGGSAGGDAGASGPAPPEVLDIAAAPEGPVLLFADRILSLGPNLEITRRTARDLAASARFPPGFLPSRLLLTALSEPLVYGQEHGTLLLLPYDGGRPELLESGVPGALEAASLTAGGVLLDDGGRLVRLKRARHGIETREIGLNARFRTGLGVDSTDRIWVFDLADRRARAFDPEGREALAIETGISGGNLLFPQVFAPRSAGGFYLGGAGELWCFGADGSPLWRLNQFSAGYRQALPAFYRMAADGDRIYILDPMGRRLLKFREPGTAARDLPERAEEEVARALSSAATLRSGSGRALRLCLEREWLLQAAYFRREADGLPVVTDLAERIRAKQARLLADLGVRMEQELRIPEAERAYTRSLGLYRELRTLDPVNPRYAEAARILGERRSAVAGIRLAETLLTASIREGEEELEIELHNTTSRSVEDVQVDVRLTDPHRWQASSALLRSGARFKVKIALPIGTPEGGIRNKEHFPASVHVLVRYRYAGNPAAQHFRLRTSLPPGTLLLGGYSRQTQTNPL